MRPLLKRAARILRSTKTWLAAVAGAGVLAAIVIGFDKRNALGDWPIHLELFKFSLTVVVGGVIAFVFRMAEVKRQIRETRQRDLRDFYRRMLGAYNAAKKTRRLLDAHSWPADKAIKMSRKILDDLMSELQSAQLDFEALWREAQAGHKLFSEEKDRAAVVGHLKSAQTYLRGVLEVHEGLAWTANPLIMKFGDKAWRPLLCFFYDAKALERENMPEADRLRFDREFSKRVEEIRKCIVHTSEEADTDV
jgi:hypothetical protein